MAPAGSSAKPRPLKAPRVPRKERNEATAKSRISRPAARRREPTTTARAAYGASFIGSTTKVVTIRMQPATKKKVG